MNIDESGTVFACHDCWLYGVVSVPERPARRGVLLVVGGPQYRTGSHRQFTLLARHLAAHGIPAFRFDYRGMGDSDGAARTFEHVNDDIHAAIGEFFHRVPDMREVVLWGLCDGASASLFYASKDKRVRGLVLLNPWARTEQGVAKAYLRHYYAKRLFDPELWGKVLRGRFDYRAAFRSARAIAGSRLQTESDSSAESRTTQPVMSTQSLPDRMLQGLTAFQGKVLLIISGNDLTAQEFVDLTKSNRQWRRALSSERIQRRELPEANHTFAQGRWRDQVAKWTRQWVQSW